MSIEFYWFAVVLTTIVSAARITRLVVVDKFPPTKWLRVKYEDATDGSDWQWLTLCGYCFGFWALLLVFVWGWLSGVYPVSGNRDLPTSTWYFNLWWAYNGLMSMAYLTGMVMAYDGSDGEDD